MGKKNRCRKSKSRGRRVVDVGSDPTQNSTSVSAFKSCEEDREKRSVVGSLVDSILKPCFGGHRRTKTTKPKNSSTSKDQSSSSKSQSVPNHPGPSLSQTKTERNASESSFLPLDGNATEIDDDNISIIGLGEISERAQEEQDSKRSEVTNDNESATSSKYASIPGIPDDLSMQPSSKTQLPPLKPLFQTRAMLSMQKALDMANEEDDLPPLLYARSQKLTPKPLDKKQQRLHDKLVKQLTKHAVNGERQAIKAKLADKKKAVNQELENVRIAKKRAKLAEELEKEWKKVDKMTRKEKNGATIQKHNAMIQTLEKEIELLKEKQGCKMMKYDLLQKKGYDGVLTETVWQCKSLKIRRRYDALGEEINELLSKVGTLQQKVKNLTPVSEKKEEFDQIVVEEANDSKQITVEEVDPLVRYGFALPVHKRNPALISLFMGESSMSQLQNKDDDYLSKFQENFKETENVSPEEPEDEMLAEKLSCSESSYSFTFEEDIDDDEDENENERPISPEPPLYRSTHTVPLHKLLPKVLEVIEEETDGDLEDYENDSDIFIHLCSKQNNSYYFETVTDDNINFSQF